MKKIMLLGIIAVSGLFSGVVSANNASPTKTDKHEKEFDVVVIDDYNCISLTNINQDLVAGEYLTFDLLKVNHNTEYKKIKGKLVNKVHRDFLFYRVKV